MPTFPTLELWSAREDQLLTLLEVLTANNAAYLAAHPEVPHPYQSGVRYQLEPFGAEVWQGVYYLLKTKRGDCEDLAAYLSGWYRARKGILARTVLIRFEKRGVRWYHAVTKLPNGKILDPSKVLGM